MTTGRAGLAACALFLVACALGYGGLLSHAYPGDTATYSAYGRALVDDGRVPYADFYDEYPPGSVPVFAAPAVIWDAHYVLVFKLLMAACGLGCVACTAWLARRLRLSPLRLAPAVLVPLALGPVFLNRYDPLPALLTSLALVALLRARGGATGALLGVATAVKVYSAVAAPLAARRLRGSPGPAASFVAAVAILVLPFFALAPGGVGFSFWTQAKRHLQIETLGSSLLLAASKLGVHRVDWIAGKPGSIDLGGATADVVATLSSLLALALVVRVAVAYWRGPDTDERLVTAWAAAVAAWTVFGKVLSPQYLTWLVPLVPLAAGRRGLNATCLLLAALVLTQAEYFLGNHGLRDQNWTVWVLLARNALLAGMFVLVYRELREGEGAPA
ncbi:MAG TPA: glycosyltransferase family 87 protein [Gaiellaceae bacterium]|nr:glycosyltransferase family 87 protein [Gaiellaceae bacterium]